MTKGEALAAGVEVAQILHDLLRAVDGTPLVSRIERAEQLLGDLLRYVEGVKGE